MGITGRPKQPSCADADWCPRETLDFLPPPLVGVLAGLQGSPESVTQAAIQLLPFGSRAALESTGMVVTGEDIDGRGHYVLRLTPLGLAVIDEAADSLDALAEDADLDIRAAQALASRR